MKSLKVLVLAACVLLLPAPARAAEEPEKPAWLSVGPRIGVTGVVTTQWRFNDQMQRIRSVDREYFPIYSQMGLNLDQRIRLGGGWSFLFRETALVGGLDQNVVLPSLTALAGMGWDIGLQALIGAELGRDSSEGSPEAVPSLALAVGWVFQAWGRPLPVSVVVVPLSVDWEPRITVLVGLDFPIRIAMPEEKAPFNY